MRDIDPTLEATVTYLDGIYHSLQDATKETALTHNEALRIAELARQWNALVDDIVLRGIGRKSETE